MALLTAPPLLEGTPSSGVYSIIPLVPYEPHQNTTPSMLAKLIILSHCTLIHCSIIFPKALPALSTTCNLSQTTSHPRWCPCPESRLGDLNPIGRGA